MEGKKKRTTRRKSHGSERCLKGCSMGVHQRRGYTNAEVVTYGGLVNWGGEAQTKKTNWKGRRRKMGLAYVYSRRTKETKK